MRRSRGPPHVQPLPAAMSVPVAVPAHRHGLAATWAAGCYAQRDRDRDRDYLTESLQERHAWARIQQRQLQEKEQKLLQLYESQQQRALDRVVTRSTSLSSSLSTAAFTTLTTTNNNVRTSLTNGLNNNNINNNGGVGGGRVRQMFDERRKPNNSAPAAPGWDRSYPLEPINKSTGAQKAASKSRGAVSLDRNGAGGGAGVPQRAAPPPQAHQPLRRAKSQARAPPSPPPQRRPQPQPEPEPEPQPEPEPPAQEAHDAELQRYLDDFSPPATPPPFDDEVDDAGAGGGEPLDAAVDASTSFVFQKLPNVGGPARAHAAVQLAEERPDRFKTYKPAAPRTRAAPRPQPQPQQPAQRAKPAARKTEVKASPPAAASTASTGSKRSSTSRASVTGSSPQHQPTTRTASNASTASRATPTAKKSPAATPSAASAASSGSARPRGAPSLRAVASAPPRDDLVECSNCGRRFATDRVAKHEEICRRTTTKKRKVFDPVKQRVQGTEAETFVRKMLLKGPPTKKETQAKKPDWRKKHEEFIATIRAAKEMKAHLAAGGKLSDLPPPPPLDTSDYIQCPHCQRRFNEAAAERHIPKCANMQHNKKPAPAARTPAGKVGARRR